MTMAARSKLFITNRSQAVRLPKIAAFPEGVREVEITQIGNSRLITPVGQSWSEWFLHGPRVSEDFMTERDDPPPEEYQPL
jgi:antitoxin VapB